MGSVKSLVYSPPSEVDKIKHALTNLLETRRSVCNIIARATIEPNSRLVSSYTYQRQLLDQKMNEYKLTLERLRFSSSESERAKVDALVRTIDDVVDGEIDWSSTPYKMNQFYA